MHERAVVAVKPLEEVKAELPLGRARAEHREVQDHREAVDEEVGHHGAGGPFERRVAVLATEDRNRDPLVLAVGARAQSPVGAHRIDQREWDVVLPEFLGEYSGGEALAGALFPEQRERRTADVVGVKPKVGRDVEVGHAALARSIWS